MTLVIIGGATATGKTELATEVCKRIGGELISADSMQIYKGLDIGTAKEKGEALGIPVFGIDIAEPSATFSVVDYRDFAIKTIENVESRGKIPVVCGGTGFYINSLVYDYSYGESASYSDEDYALILDELKVELEEKGAEFLHGELASLDKKSAELIHPNNTKRLLRALAVTKAGGKPFSSQNEGGKTPVRSDIKMFIIDYSDREALADKIARRVQIMIDMGLEDEICGLLRAGLTFDNQSMQAIGYKEWRGCFEVRASSGEFDSQHGAMIEEVKAQIIKNTKAYAKRQRTWFNNQYDFAIKVPGELTIEERVQFIIDNI